MVSVYELDVLMKAIQAAKHELMLMNKIPYSMIGKVFHKLDKRGRI